ncbi:MAG: RNA 2',3'-cyclic phosphodiesterase [Bifidobacteriaceae bacterium]|jgi:2'-5' RNA ligase|nr:RNA 2',3'-cyclic phosphodiesterase [Bifidobacteriaceae bacterium]
MRLFAAVRPPDHVKDHLAGALAGALGAATDRSVPFSPRVNWHVTLAFYGDVPDGSVTAWENGLAQELSGLAPFTVELRGAGVVRRRVGWIGVGGETRALKRAMAAATAAGELASQAVGRRPAVPGGPEARALRPHLTVTRAADRPAVKSALSALAIYRGPSWLVEEVTLISSDLGRGPGGHALYTLQSTVRLPV